MVRYNGFHDVFALPVLGNSGRLVRRLSYVAGRGWRERRKCGRFNTLQVCR
jgi:hypothetical protein